jgi:hypothetical protein
MKEKVWGKKKKEGRREEGSAPQCQKRREDYKKVK